MHANTFGGEPGPPRARFGLDGRCEEIEPRRRSRSPAAPARASSSATSVRPASTCRRSGAADVGGGARASSGRRRALADAGVDALHVETMSDLREARDRARGRAARGAGAARPRLAHLRAQEARLLHGHGRPARRGARGARGGGRGRGRRQLHPHERRHGARWRAEARAVLDRAASSSSRTPAQPELRRGAACATRRPPRSSPPTWPRSRRRASRRSAAAAAPIRASSPRSRAARARVGAPAVTGAEGRGAAAVAPRIERDEVLRFLGYPDGAQPAAARRRRARRCARPRRAAGSRARRLRACRRRARRRRRAACAPVAGRRPGRRPRHRRRRHRATRRRALRGRATRPRRSCSTRPAARRPRRPPTGWARRVVGAAAGRRPTRAAAALAAASARATAAGRWRRSARSSTACRTPRLGVELLPSMLMTPAQVDLASRCGWAPTRRPMAGLSGCARCRSRPAATAGRHDRRTAE